MNSQYEVKTMLKEKAALLHKHDSELFGKKFKNHIPDTIKSKRETRGIKKGHSPETLKYWVGVQRGQSYLMCLFSLGWPPF